MTKTMLIYPPFCTPASPPFSITNIYTFLKNNLPDGHKIEVMDLNILFHKLKFPKERSYYKSIGAGYDAEDYNTHTEAFRQLTKETYSSNNKGVIEGREPEFFDEVLQSIHEQHPDIVAFSIVYSSQAFYALALMKALKEFGIRIVVGGPAVNAKLVEAADATLKNELELLEYITGEKADHDSLDCETVLDFSIYALDDYFTPSPVIPIKTTSSCFYRRCTFCTHHQGSTYYEFDLGIIKRSIEASREKHIFFVDDMMHKKRLLELAEMLKPMDLKWMCQLRPTKDLDRETLQTLHDSGLRVVLWGVESGCDRILGLMKKGTNTPDIQRVLEGSHAVGITNVTFIMFGFPGETDAEFRETIDFLKENADSIDLVSTSIFGLQKGTPIYSHPEDFSISRIDEETRTVLEPKITYTVSEGLTPERANYLRRQHKKTLEKINKFPKTMNFFREHLLCLS